MYKLMPFRTTTGQFRMVTSLAKHHRLNSTVWCLYSPCWLFAICSDLPLVFQEQVSTNVCIGDYNPFSFVIVVRKCPLLCVACGDGVCSPGFNLSVPFLLGSRHSVSRHYLRHRVHPFS